MFGFRVVLLAKWGVYCLRVEVALRGRKGDPRDQKKTPCFGRCGAIFCPPCGVRGSSWWPMRLMQCEPPCSASRTWTGGTSLPCRARGILPIARPSMVRHLPRWLYQHLWLPSITTRRRRPFWICTKRAQLRHLGKALCAYRPRRGGEGDAGAGRASGLQMEAHPETPQRSSHRPCHTVRWHMRENSSAICHFIQSPQLLQHHG